VQETEEKYSVTVYAAHRIGRLVVGEQLWLLQHFVHRQEGFLATMEIIDRIKKRGTYLEKGNINRWEGGLALISREEALQEVREHIKNENMIRHMLATEAAMKKLAQYFNEDAELWD